MFVPLAILSVLMAYNAITGITTPMLSDAITTNSKVSDIMNKLTVDLMGIRQIESTLPPIGYSELNPGKIATLPSLSTINTVLQKSDFQYVAKIIESEPDALKAGIYKVELFEDGKSKGALYINQAIADPKTVEGFTAAWDLGNVLPGNAVYTVKVTTCPCDKTNDN